MDKSLQFFNFKDQPVRVVMIDGKPNWVLADVCKVLEIDQPIRVAERLDQDGVIKSHVVDSLGRDQEMLCVNEPNLYRTIFRSNKKQAKDFQNWVFDEVLPAIRKTGSYSLHPQGKVVSEFEMFNMPLELRKAIEDEEDKILAMTQHVKFLKYGELLRYPQQARTRGKRQVQRPKVFLCEGIEVVQLMISFVEEIA